MITRSENLKLRTRLTTGGCETKRDIGDFVLYWMATALRFGENPALELAKDLSHETKKPLLIYHGLFEDEEHASDRTHAFVMESMLDLHRQSTSAKCGLAYYPDIVTTHESQSPRATLANLARHSTAIVAEDFPTGPWSAWQEEISNSSLLKLHVVDCACILPMNVVGQAYTRAFQFRDRTNSDRKRWMAQSVQTPHDVEPYTTAALVSEPISQTTIPHQLAALRIDHAVSRIHAILGGETAAHKHWQTYRAQNLCKYHLRRNDAAHPEAVSGMSPYLHYGNIAAWTIAREAAEVAGEGSEKFLDELFVWRELAWNFCRFHPSHATLDAVPKWAVESLKATAGARSSRPTLEQIERGHTDDELFNLCQYSLVRNGYLHNNVRMTWAKAIVEWFQDPAEALQCCIALNNRYALDGRDPNSYGGILWAFGQFDSAKSPLTPRLGAVRPRPTAEHAERLDMAAYRSVVLAPQPRRFTNVVVLGAGISGLLCARALQDAGCTVTVVDKGRGVGGRMATRRRDDAAYDHGAQFFRIRDPRLQRHLQAWSDAKLVQPWNFKGPSQKSEQAWIGRGGMTALPKALAKDLDIRLSWQTQSIAGQADAWTLQSTEGDTLNADAIVLTAPVPQSLALLDAGRTSLPDIWREELNRAQYLPCFALLAELAAAPQLANGAFGYEPTSEHISWIADNTTKSLTGSKPTVTVHLRHDVSRQWFDDPHEEIIARVRDEVEALCRCSIVHAHLHRWKFAIPETVIGLQAMAHADVPGLVFAGDVFGGPRVEGAALSGLAAAGRILAEPLVPSPS